MTETGSQNLDPKSLLTHTGDKSEQSSAQSEKGIGYRSVPACHTCLCSTLLWVFLAPSKAPVSG